MLRRTKLLILSLLLGMLAAMPTLAQKPVGYSDVYCAGFYTSRDLGPLYVVAGEDKEDSLSYTTTKYIYLSQGGLAPDSEYMIVRWAKDPMKTRAYRGQRSEETPLGRLYADVARVKVFIAHPNVSLARVIFSCEEILPGDIAMPAETRPMPEYRAPQAFDQFAPPSGKAVGSIVNARDFQQFLAQGRLMHVNLGSAQVKPGDYLRIFRYARGARYGATGFGGVYGMSRGPIKRADLPRDVLGEAIVIRADENGSIAIITESLKEIALGDYVEVE